MCHAHAIRRDRGALTPLLGEDQTEVNLRCAERVGKREVRRDGSTVRLSGWIGAVSLVQPGRGANGGSGLPVCVQEPSAPLPSTTTPTAAPSANSALTMITLTK